MPNKSIADLVLESATDYAIIAMDIEGNVTFWSCGAENIFGWSKDEMLGKPAAVFFTPEDRASGIPETEMGNALSTGRGTDERWHLRKDESRFWGSGEMQPLRNADLTEGFLKIVRDRTDQRRAQEMQAVLTQELGHRLKNQLAMVQGIVNQSLRNATSIEQGRNSIESRLGVLARSHDALLSGQSGQAAVRTIVENSINLHDDGQTNQFSLAGPHIEVGPRAAISLALILHELTTNAFKYGALSTEKGGVEIDWKVSYVDGEPVFELSWRELGGPAVGQPKVFGLGSRLIKNGIPGATNRVDIDYAVERLRCTLSVAMADFQSER